MIIIFYQLFLISWNDNKNFSLFLWVITCKNEFGWGVEVKTVYYITFEPPQDFTGSPPMI